LMTSAVNLSASALEMLVDMQPDNASDAPMTAKGMIFFMFIAP
jgi:hypothetical protein